MKIALLEPLAVPEEIIQSYGNELRSRGHEFIYYNSRTEDIHELIERSKDADAVIFTNIAFPGDVINACPQLKMISVAFTGVDRVDMDTCRERGIVVCNAAGYSNHSVAELVIGQIISVLRNLVPCDARARKGETMAGLTGFELFQKTVGIIGAGAIGTRVAEILKVFNCRVLAYNRNPRKEAIEAGVEFVELDSLLALSDVVTLHVPLTESTKGMMNREAFSKMKKDSFLINAARGPVVDTSDLVDAVNSGYLAGAAIDVFEVEPPLPVDHPLLNTEKIIVTPHIAFATKESFLRRANIVFNNITLWEKGTPQNVM